MNNSVNTTKRAVLPNEVLIHSYNMMVHFYQNRYNPDAFPFAVTWHHISYWRKCVYELGKKLINAGLLTREQYLQQKYSLVACNDVMDMQRKVTRATLLLSGH